MTLKKLYLETLFNFTKGTEGILSLSDSRVRDNFMKPLGETLQTFVNDREVIYKNFCLKKEDGEPDLLEGNSYQFPPEKVEEINRELKVLGDEEVEVSTPDKLKEILEKSEYKPKIGESEIIDEILTKI